MNSMQPAQSNSAREAARLVALDEFERIRNGEPVGDPYARVARILSAFSVGSWDWATLLIERDDTEGPKVLRRMVEWYEEHDGRADDFGRLRIVIDAQRALDANAAEDPSRRSRANASTAQSAPELSQGTVRSASTQAMVHTLAAAILPATTVFVRVTGGLATTRLTMTARLP
jgi:hypothetical protein